MRSGRPGPIKGGLDPMPGGGPGPLINPGTLRPFSIATPHHAALGDQYSASAVSDASADIEQQMLDLDAAVANSLAQAAQAQAEASRMQRVRDELGVIYDSTTGGNHGS